jgi:hypothetical protein
LNQQMDYTQASCFKADFEYMLGRVADSSIHRFTPSSLYDVVILFMEVLIECSALSTSKKGIDNVQRKDCLRTKLKDVERQNSYTCCQVCVYDASCT